MSGHSKWATIKRKKGLIDQERGKVFQKLAKELYVAAKLGDPNPDNNPSLRMVMDKAKAANMPKDKVQLAIDKAKAAGAGENYESIRYEGYGPDGVAIMVDALTDNKNRTASDVRSTFTKRGGNLGSDGSVSYLFDRKGIIIIDKKLSEEEVMMCAIDSGAIDFITNDDNYEIYTTPEDFMNVKKALEGLGVYDYQMCEVTYFAKNYVTLDSDKQEKVMNLIDALEDLDDVQNVYHNLVVVNL